METTCVYNNRRLVKDSKLYIKHHIAIKNVFEECL